MGNWTARALITLTWAVAVAACVLLTVSPTFRHVYDLELFPLGCLTGWLARGIGRRR